MSQRRTTVGGRERTVSDDNDGRFELWHRPALDYEHAHHYSLLQATRADFRQRNANLYQESMNKAISAVDALE